MGLDTQLLNHRRDKNPHPEWKRLLDAAIAAAVGTHGLPPGGALNAVLAKLSPTDYAAGWVTLAAVAFAGTFASLTGIPTTMAGYGITDGVIAPSGSPLGGVLDRDSGNLVWDIDSLQQVVA